MVLVGHTFWLRGVVYSPQGDQLASVSADSTVPLWDIRTGKCRLTLTGHTNSVWGVTYSADGKLVVSGSVDKTVRLWDVSSGACRAVIENFPDSVGSVEWCTSSDGDYLVTGCQNGSVLKWKVVEDENQFRVRLQWSGSNGALIVTGASMQGARGMTVLNKQLLKQRGAVGDPEHLLRETSKKLITMASVVSMLEGTSEGSA
jgi:WD40 repeat protein